MIEKYADQIRAGTYLAIKDHIEMLKDSINSLEGRLEQQTHNAKYWKFQAESFLNASLKDRLKFLFHFKNK